MPLVRSDDYGRDEKAAESLLNRSVSAYYSNSSIQHHLRYCRHARLEEEIQAYRSDMAKLDEMAAELAKAEFLSDAVSSETLLDKEVC